MLDPLEMQGPQELRAGLDPADRRDPSEQRVSPANQANRAPRAPWDQPVLWEHQALLVGQVSVEDLDQRVHQEHQEMLAAKEPEDHRAKLDQWDHLDLLEH